MRRMWLIYAAMRQTAERAGIRIVNLSSRTVLDVFDRQDAAVHLGPPRSGATALRAAATPVISPTAVPN
jgi:hypothetical protein